MLGLKLLSVSVKKSLIVTGPLYSVGGNDTGQLGLNNGNNFSSPVQVGSLTNWSIVASGGNCSAAVKTDGTLWTWGVNDRGELGLGNTTYYSSPKQVGSLTNWKTVSVGTNSFLAIKTDGTLWGWGYNANDGQLGFGNRTNYSSPKQVGSLTTWSSISCGYIFAAATQTDGTLWAWGYNGYGQLGLGNTTQYSSPKQVGSASNWRTLADSAGFYETAFALT